MSPANASATSDVRRIVAEFASCVSSPGQQPTLRDVVFEYDTDVLATPPRGGYGLALYPGEFLTHLSGRRDTHCVCSLTFETSLGRQLTVGPAHGGGAPFAIPAPSGHELRFLTVMRNASGWSILTVRPTFVRRKRVVVDYRGQWTKLLNKMHKKAAKYDELPKAEVEPFLQSLRKTSDRLALLDDRQVVSPIALAAGFDDLLKDAYQLVFVRPNALARALLPGTSVSHRTDTLRKMAQRHQRLATWLEDPLELTERRILTDQSFRGAAKVEPLVRRFTSQPVTRLNRDAAMLVFQHHAHLISGDYVAALVRFLVCVGDLANLQDVVTSYAGQSNQTPARVFKAWGDKLPAIRLAIRYRRVAVLQWLVLDVGLSPDDASHEIPLDTDSVERCWTVDELLDRLDDTGNDDGLANCRRLVSHVRNARVFHQRTQALVRHSPRGGIELSDVASLVPLITHAFDLKWLFTLVDLCEPTAQERHQLFAHAFVHVLREDLVLDDPSRIFFKRAYRHARRLGFLSKDDAFDVKAEYAGAHVKHSVWFRELQDQVRRTVRDVGTQRARIGELHRSLHDLRASLAERELTDEARRVRKQLLAVVTSVLPVVAPAFSLLEQCLNHCDPLAVVVAIVDGVDDTELLQAFLSGPHDTPAMRRLPLQEGLEDALQGIDVDPQELVEMLRDAIRDDNPPAHGNDGETREPDQEEEPSACDEPHAVATMDTSATRPSFRAVVSRYMEQRRLLEKAMRDAMGDDYVRLSRMSLPRASEVAMDPPPTWQWYNVFAKYLPWPQ